MRFWKKKEEKKEEKKEKPFMIICGKCLWDFTDEYIKNNTDGNIRPMYGDHCSCGGTVVRVDEVEVTA